MNRWLVLVIALCSAEVAAATTWYWRPPVRSYGAATGRSYVDALRYSAEVESRLRAGDTLYICGRHEHGAGDRSLVVRRSNVTIRFDCPGDPGSILSAGLRLTPASWSGSTNGVYRQKVAVAARQVIDGSGPLTPLSRIPTSADPCRSFHLDPQGVLHYRPCGAPQVIYTSGGDTVLDVEGVYNVTIVAPRLQNANRLIRIREANRVRVLGGVLRYGIKEGIQLDGNTYAVELSDNDIGHSGTGIIARTADGQAHVKLRILRNFVHDIYGTGDSHGIGIQTASDAYLADNEIMNTDGSGIAMYWWGGRQRMERNVIERNTITGVRWSGRSAIVAGGRYGIILSGNNEPANPQYQRDNVVRNNTIRDAADAAMYVKAAWQTQAGRYAFEVRENDVAGTIVVGSMSSAGRPSAVLFVDNRGATYRSKGSAD